VATRNTTPAGAVGLAGLFAGLCAVFALVVTVFEWRAERAQAAWPVASARVERGEVAESVGSGDSRSWSLRYRVRYDAGWQEQAVTVSSHSTSSVQDAAAMRAWAQEHRRGSRVDVRYDPANPRRAVFASVDVPNAGPRTPFDVSVTLAAGVASVLLIALARFMARREPPDAATQPLSAHGKVLVGALFAAMGFLVLGIGLHSALRMPAPTSSDFIFVPAALMFVFAGVLLALPPERAALTRLFAALLITAFAVTLDWVAFGPGERRFGGGISLGFLGIGWQPGELFGRAAFGVAAVILDVLAVVLWVQLVRGRPAGAPG